MYHVCHCTTITITVHDHFNSHHHLHTIFSTHSTLSLIFLTTLDDHSYNQHALHLQNNATHNSAEKCLDNSLLCLPPSLFTLTCYGFYHYVHHCSRSSILCAPTGMRQ